MKNTFKIKIVTPNKCEYINDVSQLKIQTDNGEICILSNHEEYLANIAISAFEVKFKNEIKHFACGGGALYFNNKENTAILILNSCTPVNKIDIDKINKLKSQMEEKLKLSKTNIEQKQNELALKRIINAISARNSYKN